jgi:GDP-L-fucose synthase
LPTRAELNLIDSAAVDEFFARLQPEYVFLAAARVGGIQSNTSRPAEFIYENLAIQLNVIHAASQHRVRKLAFFGSSCIYPKYAPQPIREEYLLTGPLEPSNEPYAVAKIAGIRMVEAYTRQYGLEAVCLMPTNLYGPGDNFDLESSHVLPAMIRKFHDAKMMGAGAVRLWGTGTPRREFLHVDDLAHAAMFFMQRCNRAEVINIGTGTDLTVRELAGQVAEITGFDGGITFDPSRPDGTPRKLLDISKATALGWTASIPLIDGLRQTYAWYRQWAVAA